MTYYYKFRESTQALFLPILSPVLFFALSAMIFAGMAGCARLEADNTVSIKAVGDIMPGTNFPSNRLPGGRGERLFTKIQPYLDGADILFGNFESTLTNYPHTGKNTKRKLVFAFRTPPSYARTLKEVGFDVLTVANNHSSDFKWRGFQDTIKNVNNAGMLAVGKKGFIGYTTAKGKRVAFIGFSYIGSHNKIQDIKNSQALVRQAAANADIVVCTMHAGAEGTKALHTPNKIERFYGENRGNLVKFSRAVIDAGADLVLGHGPHVPRALELYKGRLIAYSLGNFIGYRAFRLSGPLGQSLVLDVRLSGSGEFMSGKIIPAVLKRGGIPEYDPKGKSIKLIQRLTRADFPRTPLVISNDGTISRK